MQRGEIWWHEAPGENARPYLVLTRDEGIPVLNQLLAVPATRTIRSIPTEVRLGPDDGMPAECVLTLDNVRVVRKSMLTRRITSLDPARMDDVCTALAFATACESGS
jgi:mRNA interferase MazF